MKTLHTYLDSVFTGKRVKITLGHPSNGNFITGIVTGFIDKYYMRVSTINIVLRDVKANNEWYEEICATGQMNEQPFRLDTEIEILRDLNLETLLQ